MSTFPSSLNGKLRACLSCSRIKTLTAFKREGCKNCPMLDVNESTSPSFRGIIGLVNPKGSWVGKWQRLEEYEEGVYAMTVEGILPDDMMYEMEKKGRSYVSREESFRVNE